MTKKISFFKFVISIFLIFTLLDYLIGKYLYNKFARSEFIDVDISFGLQDDIYDHKFKSSHNSTVGWGNYRYSFCTDANGFRANCKDQFSNKKEFDIAFAGDSFTEPVGLNFEKSFLTDSNVSQLLII